MYNSFVFLTFTLNEGSETDQQNRISRATSAKKRQGCLIRKSSNPRKSIRVVSQTNLPLDPNALTPGLFDELLSEQEQALIAQEASNLEEKITKTIIVTVSSRKKVHSLDTSKLEVKEIIIEPTDIDTGQYTRLGEEITDKLIHIAARIYVERTIRPKYVLKSSLQIQNPEQRPASSSHLHRAHYQSVSPPHPY